LDQEIAGIHDGRQIAWSATTLGDRPSAEAIEFRSHGRPVDLSLGNKHAARKSRFLTSWV
jgi:hypothetical protein